MRPMIQSSFNPCGGRKLYAIDLSYRIRKFQRLLYMLLSRHTIESARTSEADRPLHATMVERGQDTTTHKY
jgi:hypothetical protein